MMLRLAATAALATALAGFSAIAQARGPEGIADVAERVISAVVNISTTQNVAQRVPVPQAPQGSPFEEFFDDILRERRNTPGQRGQQQPRRVNSLGSGFIIDGAQGYVVTNNHVIADADEITVVLNDSTKLRAEILGRDKRTDLALLKVKSDRPLPSVKFGNSEKLRLGEWVVAIGNPFGLGGTVTSGIVSARNRDINQGQFDSYIQTDAAINRGNSGGPLFNLDGEVIGVNTAIISPSGTSVGIAFAVPSATAISVIEQLRLNGEVRRGWLGVRIQPVTDEIAESLNIKPTRGALVAGIDEKGPAKPAGIEAGDVVIKFDGKDIKEMKDLPRIVADTPVGKDVAVLIVRKGVEETKTLKLGELESDEKPVKASVTTAPPPAAAQPDKTVVQRTLGLDLAGLTNDLRTRFKIRDTVKGVVVMGVEPNSDASEKRLSAGDVIVEIAQESVTNAADVQTRIDAIKKDGRKSVLMLVANGNGELRFVALSIQ